MRLYLRPYSISFLACAARTLPGKSSHDAVCYTNRGFPFAGEPRRLGPIRMPSLRASCVFQKLRQIQVANVGYLSNYRNDSRHSVSVASRDSVVNRVATGLKNQILDWRDEAEFKERESGDGRHWAKHQPDSAGRRNRRNRRARRTRHRHEHRQKKGSGPRIVV